MCVQEVFYGVTPTMYVCMYVSQSRLHVGHSVQIRSVTGIPAVTEDGRIRNPKGKIWNGIFFGYSAAFHSLLTTHTEGSP